MARAAMRGLAAVAVLALSATAYAAGPSALIDEGAGAVSQTLCTKVFVSGLAPDAVMRDHLRPEPGMGLIAWALMTDIDRAKREVRTRVLGADRTSVYAAGRGCTLRYAGRPEPQPLSQGAAGPALLGEIAGPATVSATDPRLVAALDAAFAEPTSGPPRRTQAIVVVHGGRVIAERYAPGLTPDTPLLSHSLAKSVISALAGNLVQDGRLDLKAPAGRLAALGWSDGPHAGVTLEHLLRMDAGFGFDEGVGSSPATHIWFAEPDTAAAAARAPLRSAPGAAWGYCSRCYVLAARIVAEAVGGTPAAFRAFADQSLFGPLGMTSAQFEFDAAGTPMGANAMTATPRDFAKFGLLYLHDGEIGGRRLLPAGWVAASRTPTAGGGYGMGFWLNTTDAPLKEWNMNWGMPGAPRDAYFARGYLGQFIVIVPSADLVVVRFGQSHARGGDIASVGALTAQVIAALR